MRPFRRINFDDIRVPHNQHRAFFAIATQTSHKVWPLRIESEDFGFDAFTIQNRFQVFNHDAFIAGWIAGVQAQNRLEMAHGFFFDLRPIRLPRFLRRSRIEQNNQREQSQTSKRHEMPSESVWFLRLRRVMTGRIVTSRMTAARMTQPVTNRRVGSWAPICASPAPRTAMINTPKNVFTTEPRPPDKLAPPMTHAAMACNSAPAPAFGSAEDKRAHCITAAQAASNPLRPNTATLIGRGLTPV